MGKSLDLPDPLESASTRPLGNADDLLAQLAGEEVDRLLAEADAEQGPSSDQAAPHAREEAPIPEQLDALFSQIGTEGTGSIPGPAQPFHAPDPDAVMSALREDPDNLALVAPPLPMHPTVALIAEPSPALRGRVNAPSADAETTSAERRGLTEPDPADELPAPGELQAVALEAEEDMPLPVYLKPLEWLNAPLDFLPPAARDVLGQIAILTLVNAIAVLIYVFVFRKS